MLKKKYSGKRQKNGIIELAVFAMEKTTIPQS